MSDNDTATYQDFLKDFQPGAFLGNRYKLLKTIGAGGMGRVFLAHDTELDIDVALKVIRPELLQSEKAVDRFKNELILARKVSHKNVVRIHDIGEVRGLKYLSMSYIAGKSLKEVLRESGGLNPDRAINIFTQICEGVAAAHDEGVIHRDLKPANVMLDEKDRVYLTDFGIAKWLDAPDETATGMLIGTPAYLSPEQTWGERPDIRSDIYSLGLILYETLEGELPFDSDTAVSFKSKLPPSLPKKLKATHPDIPRYLISIIQKCLDPRRGERYQTVAAILHDLQRQNVVAKISVKRVAAIAASLLLLLLAAFVVPKFLHRSTSPTRAEVPVPVSIHTAVVLPFRNKTGQEQLNWIESTMGDLLIADLSQNPNFRIVNSDRVFQTLKDLKVAPGSYDEETARKVGELLDVDLVIEGNVTQAGTLLRADTQVGNIKEPQKTAYFKVVGNKQEDLLPMVDQLAQQIQRTLATTPAPAKEIAEISTPSIAALKSFDQGVQNFRQGKYDEAAEAFNESILKDPKFASAYFRLGQTYEQLGQDDQASAILQKAIDSRAQGDAKTNALIRAEHALLNGDSAKAITTYQTIARQYPHDPDVLLDLAKVYEETGDLNSAATALEKVIRLDSNNAEAYFEIGKDTILTGGSEKAIGQYLVKALSIQTQLNNRQGQADVLNAMGVAYERLGRYNEALKYYQDSLAIKEEIGNKKSATTSLTNIAKIYIFQSEFEKAKDILNRAMSAYQEMKDQAGLADVQNTFGVIYENQGQYEQALKYYKNALQMRKQLGDDRLTALSYDNIGQIYYLMAHYDEAQAFSEQALALRKKVGDQNGIILSLQNMGFLQMAQGELDRALKYFLDALNQARAIHFENAIAVSLGNLGSIYQNEGRYNAALDSYQEAIDILRQLKDKKGEAEYTKLAGATFLEMGSFAAASDKLNASAQMAEQMGSGEILTDVDVLRARLNRLQSKLPEAQQEVEKALQNASKNEYQKGALAAKIEKGLLTHSGSLLTNALKEATDLEDVWLMFASKYSLAFFYSQAGDQKKTIQVCEDAIPIARKMGLTPYLYRFHSIAAQAYAKSNQQQKAMEHFREAAGYIATIKKDIKPEYLADFSNIQEVKAVVSQ